MKRKFGRKTANRIIGCCLSATMVIGGLALSPIGTMEAQATTTAKKVNLNIYDSVTGEYSIDGISGTSVNTNSAATIYYGAYPDVTDVAGTPGDPIAWRVIGYNGAGVAQTSGSDTATLLAADAVIHRQKFREEFNNNYSGSNLQTQINSIASGLTQTEGLAVSKRTLAVCTGGAGENHDVDHDTGVDGTQHCNGITGDIVTDAVMWPLSTDEANAIGDNNLRKTTDSSTRCWLRSPGRILLQSAYVYCEGDVHSFGYLVYFEVGSVRPAFHLNLSKVLFSTACGANKSADYAAFNAVTDNTAGENTWKLTLQGTDQTITPQVTAGNVNLTTGYTAENVTISHLDASTTLPGANQVSAMLADSTGTVLYYGKVSSDTVSDTVTQSSVTIPAGLTVGYYKLFVFAEQVNTGNLTDYASRLGDYVEIKVSAPSPTTPGSNPTPGTNPTPVITPPAPTNSGNVSTYRDAYGEYLGAQANKIRNAKPGDTVIIESEIWHSYPLWFMQLLQERSDITIQMKYRYQGYEYQLTITRGQKYLLGVEVPYYGPLKLAEMFNATGTKLGN